jgi:hypothetical protein
MKDRSAWELAHVPVETEPVEETSADSLSGYPIGSPALLGA